MIAGSMEIQIWANVARIADDMHKATGIVTDAAEKIEKLLGTIGVGFSAYELLEKINSVTEGMAKLQQASEKTGASVENLSKLQFFAGVSGSNIDSVTQALAKLSKGMAVGGEDTGKVTQALKFLGLSAKDAAGNLKDPSELFGEISKKLIGYQDGAGKAAIAQALFGKAGVEMLPTLKKMAELGDVEASVTADQAKAAEEYRIELARLQQQKDILWNRVTSAILPAMQSFVGVLLEAAKQTDGLGGKAKGLAADGSITSWADNAAIGLARVVDVLILIPKLITSFSDSITVMVADVAVANAAAKLVNPISLASAVANGENPLEDFKVALNARNAILADANAKRAELYDADKTAFSRAVEAKIAARKTEVAVASAAGDKPLNFGIGDAAKAAAELKLYATSMQALEQELGKLNKETQLQKTTYQLYGQNIIDVDGKTIHLTGSLEKLTDAHKKQELIKAALVDSTRREIEQTAAYNKVLDEEDARVQAKIDLAQKLIEGMQVSNEKTAFENTLIGMSADERERLNNEFERTIKLRGIDSPLQIAAINKEFDALAGLTKTRQELNNQVSTWTELSGGAGKFFGDLAVNGKSAFDRLKSSLKSFTEQLIAMFAQKWILQVAAGVTGSAALGSAAASVGSSGGLVSATGNALGLSGSGGLYGTLAGSSVGQAAGLSTGYATAGGTAPLWGGSATTAGLTEAGTTGASIASGFATAMPYVAAAIVAYELLSKKGGGPQQGQYGTQAVGGAYASAYTLSGGDSLGNQALSTSISNQIAQIAALAGKSAADISIGQGYKLDPQGTAAGQAYRDIYVNGKAIVGGGGMATPEWTGGNNDASGAANFLGTLHTSELQALIKSLGDPALITASNALMANYGELEKSLPAYLTAQAAQKAMSLSMMTDAEKLADTTATMNAGFAAIGVSVPASAEAFRSLINSLDLTTTAGQTELAALNQLGPAFLQVAQATAGVTTATAAAATAMRSAADILNERQGLQDQYDNLTMTQVQLLTKQRSALDASNQSLFDQVQAATAAKAASDAAAAQAQTDVQTAQTLAAQKRQLDIQLMTATGDVASATAAQHVDALAALDPSLRSTQQAIWDATDASTAMAKAAQEAAAATSAQAAASQQAAQAAQAAQQKLDAMSQSIESTIANLFGTSGSAGMSYQTAKSSLAGMLAQGGIPDQASLSQMLSGIKISTSSFSTKQDYQREVMSTAGMLQSLDSLINKSATSIPAYASGGDHSGGWAIVGEQGPELINLPPSTVFNASKSSQMLDNSALIAEVRALRGEVASLRKSADTSATSNKRLTDLMWNLAPDGQKLRTLAS